MAKQDPVASGRVVALSPDDGSTINLGRPVVAAILSWLVPGLGQIVQGRRLKGLLFMASLVPTFLAGMWLGDGRVVYASWKPGETRWAFICQAGIGTAALPAMIQSWRLAGPAKQPAFCSTFMAPPLSRGQPVSQAYAAAIMRRDPDITADDFRPLPPWLQFRPLPPPGMLDRTPADQVSVWHKRLGRFFEIGTLYTMLAGMLNVLVVYDAFSGPMHPTPRDEKGPRDDKGPRDEKGTR